jgi:uncharacterized RDD family membrane protein YckC
VKPIKPARVRRALMTPEGVPIHLLLADAGERIAALFIDLVAIVVAGLLLRALAERGLTAAEEQASWKAALLILLLFLLQNFYFVFFELRWQGQTPGKRLLKTRVVDGRGGPLTAEAIVTRNLVRQVELFLPLGICLAPTVVWPGAPAWAALAAGGWAFIALFLPLFNRDRARIGDLLAGTRVVVAPRARLLADLAATPVRPDSYAFTDAQLDVYGAYELQVLDGVLRDGAAGDKIGAVYRSICKKIGWQPPDGLREVSERQWLEDFYVALRARLERKLLFGKRKADKHARD